MSIIVISDTDMGSESSKHDDFSKFLDLEKLEEGGYLATSETLQGLIAQGRTIAETIEIAQDVAKKLHDKTSFKDRRRTGRAAACGAAPMEAREGGQVFKAIPSNLPCSNLFGEEYQEVFLLRVPDAYQHDGYALKESPVIAYERRYDKYHIVYIYMEAPDGNRNDHLRFLYRINRIYRICITQEKLRHSIRR